MKTKQVLSLAASAMTKGSSNLRDKSHCSFSNFSLSKGGCVGEGGGLVDLVGWFVLTFWFSIFFHRENSSCYILFFFSSVPDVTSFKHSVPAAIFLYLALMTPLPMRPVVLFLLWPSITYSRSPLATFKLKIPHGCGEKGTGWA